MCECPEFDDCNCSPAPCTDCIDPDLMVVRYVSSPSLCDDVANVIKDALGAKPACKLTFGGSIIQGTTITIIPANSNNAVQFSNDGVLWQDSATFTNQLPGPRKYYIREAGNQACVAANYVTVPGCATPAPSVVTPVNYVQNTTASPLQATGVALKWYTTATGGTASTVVPVPSTTAVGLTSYYVSQTLNGCEGPRAQIQVQVSASGCVPGQTVDVSPQVTECINGFVNIKTTDGCSFGWRVTSATCGGSGCVYPVGPNSIQTVSSTCDNAGNYLNNGHFEYGPVYNADRYAYYLPGTQTRPVYADALTVPENGLIEVTGIPGASTDKSYRLIVFNGTTECFIERIANFGLVTCTITCVTPTFNFVKTDATCNGTATLSNGILRLTNIVNGTRFQLCEGNTFQCPSDYDNATVFSGAGPITMASNIGFTSSQEYRDFNVRVFNNSSTCYTTTPLRFYNQCYQTPCINPTHGTVSVTPATCASSSGTINNNAIISIPGVGNTTKYGYSSGTVYSGPTYSTAFDSGSTITIANLNGSSTDSPYVIRMFNGRNNCFIDVAVTVPGVNCVVPCDTPAFTITSTPPTCTDGNANSNGTVSITSITNGTKYQICLDSTFTCTPNYVGSPTISGAGPIVVFNTLGFDPGQEYKDFTVRVYNGSETCFNTHTLRINNPCYVCCGLAINSITLTNT